MSKIKKKVTEEKKQIKDNASFTSNDKINNLNLIQNSNSNLNIMKSVPNKAVNLFNKGKKQNKNEEKKVNKTSINLNAIKKSEPTKLVNKKVNSNNNQSQKNKNKNKNKNKEKEKDKEKEKEIEIYKNNNFKKRKRNSTSPLKERGFSAEQSKTNNQIKNDNSMNEKIEKNLNTTKSYTYLSNTKIKMSNSDIKENNSNNKEIKINSANKQKSKVLINEKNEEKKTENKNKKIEKKIICNTRPNSNRDSRERDRDLNKTLNNRKIKNPLKNSNTNTLKPKSKGMKIPIKNLTPKSNEKLIERRKKREEEKLKRNEEYEKIDVENEKNINNILYQISKFDDFLNFFSNYLIEVNINNINNDNFFNEITLINQSTEELNLKIKIIESYLKDNLEKNIKTITTTKETSEQRTIIYNQCFEQCSTILLEINNLLNSYLTKEKEDKKIKEENTKEMNKENNKSKSDLSQIKKLSKMIKKSTKKFSKKSILSNDENFDDDIDEEANIDTENSKPIGVNLIKANYFNVEKPHEENLKYTLYKEKSALLIDEDELEFDIKQCDISKIIIGEIEPFRDIIEADKINLYKHQRSKSSFNLKSKMSKKKFNFENIHILEEGHQIDDLEGEDSVDDNLSEDNDGFDDDIIAFGDNSNSVKRLLPYHISKISFCKKFAEGNDNYEFINEDETLKKKEMKIHKSKSRSKGKFTRTKSKLNNKNNTNNKNNNNNKNNINNNNENENIINIIQRKNQELQIQRIPSDECIIY